MYYVKNMNIISIPLYYSMFLYFRVIYYINIMYYYYYKILLLVNIDETILSYNPIFYMIKVFFIIIV